jgi:hypothetical protein
VRKKFLFRSSAVLLRMCLCEKFLFEIFSLKGTLLSLFLSSGKEMCLRVSLKEED